MPAPPCQLIGDVVGDLIKGAQSTEPPPSGWPPGRAYELPPLTAQQPARARVEVRHRDAGQELGRGGERAEMVVLPEMRGQGPRLVPARIPLSLPRPPPPEPKFTCLPCPVPPQGLPPYTAPVCCYSLVGLLLPPGGRGAAAAAAAAATTLLPRAPLPLLIACTCAACLPDETQVAAGGLGGGPRPVWTVWTPAGFCAHAAAATAAATRPLQPPLPQDWRQVVTFLPPPDTTTLIPQNPAAAALSSGPQPVPLGRWLADAGFTVAPASDMLRWAFMNEWGDRPRVAVRD